jgi:hypothetical protein
MGPEDAARQALRLIEAERFDDAWAALAPVHTYAVRSDEVASALLAVLEKLSSPPPVGSTLRAMLETHKDPWVIYRTSLLLLAPIDGRHTDDEIGEDDPPLAVIPAAQRALATLIAEAKPDPDLGFMWILLGNAYRYAGPSYDQKAEHAYLAALALEDRTTWWFDLGLLYKNRARFEEGVEIYRSLLNGGNEGESVLWNLGICATGAGLGEIACDAWTRAGYAVTLDEDGLPRMEGLGRVKVRLSTGSFHETCERSYEHVWVQPRSPCHGRILNATMYDHGYEVGDMVVWDGQSIGRFRQGELEGPRFAALGKLGEGGFRTFAFRGRQSSRGQIERISDGLPGDNQVYSFDEQIVFLCKECVRTGGPHTHLHQHADTREITLVRGKLVLGPGTEPKQFIGALEAAITREPGVVIASPDLYAAAGDTEQAERHAQLIEDLANLA